MTGQASLNHIFRTVWNHALGAMVAVSEVGAARGKSGSQQTTVVPFAPDFFRLNTTSALVAIAWAATTSVAVANPTGGVAVVGSMTTSTQGSKLTVTTQNGAGTNHSAINWQSFSIPLGSSTYFQQPSASSAVINRVVTNTPSQLFGTLGSNGHVVLVNQAGITVGAGAVVDTAGFTASALKMTDADALAARMRFGDGTSGGNVSVQGQVLARSGDVVLIGSNVDTGKDALVQAPNGSTVLAAGNQVEITGRGLEGISMTVQAPENSAVNLGTLQGDAVGIFAGTLKHSSAIQATRATLEGGKVVLKAVGDAIVDGAATITASGTTGGSVDVLGKRVGLTASASIDASGTLGGGQVRVGGDYQGKNTVVPNAEFAYMGKDVRIKASATDKGNGGRVIVWADDTTRVYGVIEAKGGVNGGDGGFVETSGKRGLAIDGVRVSASGLNGNTGTWLLDPADVTITSSVSSGASFDPVAANRTLFTPITDTVQIGASDITAALQAGTNVTITTYDTTLNTTPFGTGSGNITVAAALNWDGYGSALTLDANNDIIVSNGTGSFSADAGTLRLLAGNRPAATSGEIKNNGSSVHVLKLEAVANQNINISGNNKISVVAGKSVNGAFNLEVASPSSLDVNSVGGSVGITAKTGIDIKQYNAFSTNPGISVSKLVNTTESSGSETTQIWVASGTGNLIQQSGGNISGRFVKLRAGNSVNLNSDVNSGASGLTSDTLYVDAPGGVNQIAGKIVSAGGNSKFLAYNGKNVTIDSITNDFDRVEVSNSSNFASSITIKDTNDVYLKGLNANGAISVVASGAIKQDAGGGVATSAGGISLSGASIGASGSGNYVNVSTSAGTLQLTASSGGIYVHNSSGVQTSKYTTINAGGSGQDVMLSGDTVQVDSFSGYAANTNDDVLGFISTTNGSSSILVSATGSKSAGKFLLDASAGGSINLGSLIYVGPVKLSGSSYSLLGNPTISGGNDLWINVSSGSSNSFGGVTPSFSGGGRWLVAQTASCACSWSGTPGGTIEAFRQYGYSNGASIAGVGNGVLNFDTYSIVPSNLSGTVSKIYDGSTSINLSGATVSVDGYSLPSDQYGSSTPLTVAISGTGALIDPNVGTGKQVELNANSVLGMVTGYSGVKFYGLSMDLQSPVSADIGTVNPARAIATIGLSGTRQYDGTNIVQASIFKLTGLVNGETLTLTGTGTLADKNVGENKPVSLGALSLSNGSGLASNYTLSGGTHTATITTKTLTSADISGLLAKTREYDGTDVATLNTTGTTLKVLGSDLVSLDTTSAIAKFDDRNKGVDKVVTVQGLALSGDDAKNYVIDAAEILKTKGEITQRPLSVWKGGASGAWGGAANWDALPDADNVKAVQIAAGTAITIDSDVAPIQLASLSMPGGSLTVNGTSLTVGSGLSLSGLNLVTGTLDVLSGDLTAAGQFAQSGGAIRVGGALVATQGSGNLVVGAIEAKSVDLTAASGSISQVGGIASSGLVKASAQGAVDLSSTENRLSIVQLASTGSGDVKLVNTGVLSVQGISTANGSIKVDNTGAITTSGPIVAVGGGIEGIAHSPITVGTGGLSATGNVLLSALTKDGSSTVTLNGPVRSTGGSVSIQAAKDIVQNSSVYGAKGVAVNAEGTLILGANAVTVGAPIQYLAAGSTVAPPVGPSSLAANEKVESLVSAFMQSFQDILEESVRGNASEDLNQTETADSAKEKKKVDEVEKAGGEICLR